MLGEGTFQPYAVNTFSHRGKQFATLTPVHYVTPHQVSSYRRKDGTFVSGFGETEMAIRVLIAQQAIFPEIQMQFQRYSRKAEDDETERNSKYTEYKTSGNHKVMFHRRQEDNIPFAKCFVSGTVEGKTELLDESLIDNMFEQMARAVKTSYSKYNMIPDEIIIRNANLWEQQEKEKEAAEKNEPKMIESYEPRFALEQVALNEKVREQIKTAIAAVRYKGKMTEEWGMGKYFAGNRAIILNFYGKAGTGKSMTAEAVAKALGKKVYHINYSELESKYVGETPKNIRKAFECATKDDAVLIFDEADSFLGKRLTSVTQSADYGVNITRSVLLMELEKFNGVVVFTTNLINNYDEAFKRRILLSVYFDMPDEAARCKIWRLHLSEKMPLCSEVTAESLAGRYDGISGADIKDMVFYAALYALEKEKAVMDFSVFDYAYVTIQGRYQNKGEPEAKVVSVESITEEQYRKEVNRQEG